LARGLIYPYSLVCMILLVEIRKFKDRNKFSLVY
jgi:hypothetical protein